MTTPQSGREAFEAWWGCPLRRNEDDTGYADRMTDAAWRAWQAALAQQGREVGEPVAWMRPEELRHLAKQSGVANADAWNCSSGSERIPLYTAAPKQQAVDDAMLSHIAAVIDGTLATCVSDATTEERMYVGEQCLNELANIRAALLAALPGKTEVDRG